MNSLQWLVFSPGNFCNASVEKFLATMINDIYIDDDTKKNDVCNSTILRHFAMIQYSNCGSGTLSDKKNWGPSSNQL